jgi:hypothetical protein
VQSGKYLVIIGLDECIDRWLDYLQYLRDRVGQLRVRAWRLRRSGGDWVTRGGLMWDCHSQVAMMREHVLLGEEVVKAMRKVRNLTGVEMADFMRSDDCVLDAGWSRGEESDGEPYHQSVLLDIRGDGSRGRPYEV